MIEPKPAKILAGITADAFYNPYTDEVFYNETLDGFPKVRDWILKHEMTHQEFGSNYYSKHIILEYKDYWKLLSLDYYHYWEKKQYEHISIPNKKRKFLKELYYAFATAPLALIIPLLQPLVFIYYKLRKK